MAQEVLRMQNITKIYPNGFVANKDVSFGVNDKEIHALVGENGAGKTTLMKILFGMENSQSGEIFVNGEKVVFKSPLDAIAYGVGMIHQHFMLANSLTVAENVVLGIEPRKNGLFDRERAVQMTQEIADKYGFQVDATAKVRDLTIGQMQKVEILKALIKGVKVLIMDEPTAVLTPQETTELFEQLKVLRDDGHSIVFISHKLEEVMGLCDRVTVLRHGYGVGTYDIKDMTETKISRMMVGRDVILKMEKEDAHPGKPIVEIKGLIKINAAGNRCIDDLSVTLREGEVVGVAGVEGNGQSDLANVVCGLETYAAGDIVINGKNIKQMSIRDIRENGLAVIAEDRLAYGCAPDMSVKFNLIADRYSRPEFRKGIIINWKHVNEVADDLIKEFEIACGDRDEPVRLLSGGNIQKVAVAREFSSGANIIVANQPTRGIDVGTAEMVRKTIIRKAREENVATLLISADLNELLEVSDKLLVMRKGKIVAAFPKAQEVSEDTLGEYMLGIKTMSAEEMEGLL